MKKTNNKILETKKIHIKDASKYGKEAYSILVKKFRHSTFWFVTLNIFALTIVSSLIIFNLFAIRWNGGEETITDITKSNPDLGYLLTKSLPLFLTGVTLNAASILFTTALAFFTFKPKSKLLKKALFEIKKEHVRWKMKIGKYQLPERDSILISRISTIVETTV